MDAQKGKLSGKPVSEAAETSGKYDQLAARAMNRLGDILEKEPAKKALKAS
jgi:hypothetical protein